MRERIEQLGDILLAAAHADHHIEAAEIDKIEEILKGVWRQEASPDSLVRRVTEFRDGETVDAEEMARLGSVLRDLQPREELPSALVQRLADFDPARFDIDEAVGPFLHEPYEFKRRLLEMAVTVHESDGELDFAEDTFIRELGYKLGLELHQFQDLLLEFIPGEEPKAGAPAARSRPEPGGNGRLPEKDWSRTEEGDAMAEDLAGTDQPTQLLVPPAGGEPGALLVSPDEVGRRLGKKAAAKKKAPAAQKKAPAATKKKKKKKKAPAGKKTAGKKVARKSPAKKAPAAKKKAVGKRSAAKKKKKKKR